MIEQMIVEGRLNKLNKSNIPNAVNTKLTDTSFIYDGVTYSFLDYAVPYMWGTLGILYNVDKISPDDVKSWGALLEPQGNHAGQVFMKESVRDAYLAAVAYLNRDSDSALQDIINKTDTATIASVEQLLKKQPVLGYESDEGKGEMVAGKGHMGLMWSGDAVWAFDEEYAAAQNNRAVTLAYYVPEEGSNIWSDCFVIPTGAKNVPAAEAFLNFLCTKEIALRNMEYTGYTTAVTEAFDEYQEELLEDDEFWASRAFTLRPTITVDNEEVNFADWYKDMYIDALFPSDETKARCGIMHYFGADDEAIANMWMKVRL
jgi:spermidine/putrescine transport system substrate-binding protein